MPNKWKVSLNLTDLAEDEDDLLNQDSLIEELTNHINEIGDLEIENLRVEKE